MELRRPSQAARIERLDAQFFAAFSLAAARSSCTRARNPSFSNVSPKLAWANFRQRRGDIRAWRGFAGMAKDGRFHRLPSSFQTYFPPPGQTSRVCQNCCCNSTGSRSGKRRFHSLRIGRLLQARACICERIRIGEEVPKNDPPPWFELQPEAFAEPGIFGSRFRFAFGFRIGAIRVAIDCFFQKPLAKSNQQSIVGDRVVERHGTVRFRQVGFGAGGRR